MRNKTLIFILFFCVSNTNAQNLNPFESIGKKGKILTLSNGKYTEVHINDSLQRIGSVIVNMNTGMIYELLNIDTLYSEATLDPTIISRWYSVDPASSLFPNESPYMFSGNNPIFYIDQYGKWKVRFRNNNDHSAGIVFEAEAGDNLQTLAIQMGLPYKDLINQNFNGKDFTSDAPLKGGEWLTQENLPGVEAFQNINKFLREGNDNSDFNCAAFCIFGVEGAADGWVDPEDMDDQLRESYSNIASQGDAQIGDIIRFSMTFDYFDYQYGYEAQQQGVDIKEYYNNEIKTAGSHYSLVLLLNSDGKSIQYTIQKPGVTPVNISGYPGQSPSTKADIGVDGMILDEPQPMKGDVTPIYRKKED